MIDLHLKRMYRNPRSIMKLVQRTREERFPFASRFPMIRWLAPHAAMLLEAGRSGCIRKGARYFRLDGLEVHRPGKDIEMWPLQGAITIDIAHHRSSWEISKLACIVVRRMQYRSMKHSF
jgi:hypothetical protein